MNPTDASAVVEQIRISPLYYLICSSAVNPTDNAVNCTSVDYVMLSVTLSFQQRTENRLLDARVLGSGFDETTRE